MLLNASLVFGSMQMALASGMTMSDANAMDHSTANKKNVPCKHASSTMHRVKLRTNDKPHQMNHSSMMHTQHGIMPNKQMSMNEMDHEQHNCDCPKLCAECCGDHGMAAILNIEFFQVIKQASSQPDSTFTYYTPISLPIEIPPPVV